MRVRARTRRMGRRGEGRLHAQKLPRYARALFPAHFFPTVLTTSLIPSLHNLTPPYFTLLYFTPPPTPLCVASIGGKFVDFCNAPPRCYSIKKFVFIVFCFLFLFFLRDVTKFGCWNNVEKKRIITPATYPKTESVCWRVFSVIFIYLILILFFFLFLKYLFF